MFKKPSLANWILVVVVELTCQHMKFKSLRRCAYFSEMVSRFRGKFAIVCAIAAHCKMLPYDALCYIP
jgi:hypothetical protein